ncbi:MAG: dTMP kinase [Lentisphaeraceae bacterium]|nr:dTMP kinase [Lentisphaeraceae bacterium]
MARGKFITLEGPEGAGKSTHLARLAEALRERGIEVLTTREPGGTPLCEAVRGILQFNAAGEAPQTRAEVLLFLASRAQLVAQVIEPALARGTWVLCDRFCDSTFAYQGYGRGLELAQLRALNAFATGGLMPDLTLLLDIPEAESARRLAERKGPADRFEQEQAAFHRRLAEGFREMAAAEPARFRVIDSSGSEAQTAEQILAAVESFT